jgi:hypothetical protein
VHITSRNGIASEMERRNRIMAAGSENMSLKVVLGQI